MSGEDLFIIRQAHGSWRASGLREKLADENTLALALLAAPPTPVPVRGVVRSKLRKSNRTESERRAERKASYSNLPHQDGHGARCQTEGARTQRGGRWEQRQLAAVTKNSKLTHGWCLRVKNQTVGLLIILGCLLSAVKYQEPGKQGIQSEGYKERG